MHNKIYYEIWITGKSRNSKFHYVNKTERKTEVNFKFHTHENTVILSSGEIYLKNYKPKSLKE
jgi:hypothetical protein